MAVTSAPNQGPHVENNELGGIIQSELRNSLTYDQTQISNKRALTLEYIRGYMPDLPGRQNGSQQTDRTISDVRSWMLPGIMRTMTASDQMVRRSGTRLFLVCENGQVMLGGRLHSPPGTRCRDRA